MVRDNMMQNLGLLKVITDCAVGSVKRLWTTLVSYDLDCILVTRQKFAIPDPAQSNLLLS